MSWMRIKRSNGRSSSLPGAQAAKLEISQRLVGHSGCVNVVNWSDCGGYLVTGSDDTTVRVWRRTRYGAEPLAKLDAAHEGNVFGSCFCPGHPSIIASSSASGDVRVLSVERPSHPLVRSWPGAHGSMAHEVTWVTPQVFLSCGGDGAVRLWDLREGGTTGALWYQAPKPAADGVPSQGNGLSTISARPNRPEHIAVAGRSPFIRILDLRAAGMPRRNREEGIVAAKLWAGPSLMGQGSPSVTGISFSLDGNRLVAAPSRSSALVFDIHTAMQGIDTPAMDPQIILPSLNDAPSLHRSHQFDPPPPLSEMSPYPDRVPKRGLLTIQMDAPEDADVDLLRRSAPASWMNVHGAPGGRRAADDSVRACLPRLVGALHARTAKEISFAGEDDSFVAMGSDVGVLVVWDIRKRSMLQAVHAARDAGAPGPVIAPCRMIAADGRVVNCVRPHPDRSSFLLAVSGIDNDVKLVQPCGRAHSLCLPPRKSFAELRPPQEGEPEDGDLAFESRRYTLDEGSSGEESEDETQKYTEEQYSFHDTVTSGAKGAARAISDARRFESNQNGQDTEELRGSHQEADLHAVLPKRPIGKVLSPNETANVVLFAERATRGVPAHYNPREDPTNTRETISRDMLLRLLLMRAAMNRRDRDDDDDDE